MISKLINPITFAFLYLFIWIADMISTFTLLHFYAPLVRETNPLGATPILVLLGLIMCGIFFSLAYSINWLRGRYPEEKLYFLAQIVFIFTVLLTSIRTLDCVINNIRVWKRLIQVYGL